MSTISQTIPSYVAGISEQPDQLKLSGQVKDCVNALPDVTRMLGKRPGCEFLREDIGANAHLGHWFDIYRDPNEQYIGSVRTGGTVDVFRVVHAPLRTYRNAGDTADVQRRFYTIVSNLGTDTSTSGANQAATINDVGTTNITDVNSTGLTVNVTVDSVGRISAALVKRIGLDIQSTTNANGYQAGDVLTINLNRPTALDTFNPALPSTTNNYTNGTYTNVATTSAGTGTGLTVDVTVAGTNVTAITINNRGSGYANNEVLTIAGANIGSGPNITCQVNDLLTNPQATFFAGTVGEQCNIKYDDVGHRINDLNATGTIAPTTADTNCEYLEHTDSARIKSLTVNDTTCFVNRDTITAMTSATEPAAANEGFMEVTVLAFNQVYQFNIIQNGTTTEIISAATPDGTSPSTIGTVEALLDDLKAKVDAVTNFTATKIGNGLHIVASAGGIFSLETPERQLMNVFTDEVQDLATLPDQCHNGFIAKIANSGSAEDDYYVRFAGSNGVDGQGTWEEWREPGVETTIDKDTMPHIMFRQSDGSFLVCPTIYDERLVGDTLTNPTPSFVGSTINNVTLFRNRLGFLSRQNLILSRPGDFFNFFVATALAITARDPIDLSAASPNPATLFDSIEVNTGLVLFSRTEQFMLTTDNDVLSPETAKINFVSSFNYNENVSPFSLGTTIGFLNDEGSNTRLYEMANPPREGQPEVIEQSKIISNLYPTGINQIATSKNNTIVLTVASGSRDIFGYRYYNTTERRLQSAWFKLRMSGDVIYHTIIRDTYWAIVRNLDTTPNPDVNIVTIQKMELKQNDGTVTVNNATQGIITYLDNKREVPSTDLTYNAGTDATTFTLPWTYDQTKFNATTFETGLTVFQLGDGADGRVVDIVSAGGTPPRINTIDATFSTVTLRGRWDEQTDIAITNAAVGANLSTGTFAGLGTTGGSGTGLLLSGEVDVDGNLSSIQIVNPGSGYTTGDVVTIRVREADLTVDPTLPAVDTTATCTLTITPQSIFVGYAYEMDVQFPVIYPIKGSGDSARSDVQGSLIIHRVKVNTNSTGTFQMELNRKYRDTFSTTHEAKTFDSYLADDIAIGDVDETVVACYDRNTNVDLHLKSSYPLPVTLISMTWEGEYTNKNYRRA
jgi:hypothetical protein